MEAKRILYSMMAAGGFLGLTVVTPGCENPQPIPPQNSVARSSPTAEGGPTPAATPTARIAYPGSEGTSNPQLKPTINIPATVQAQALATATAQEARIQAALRRPTMVPAPRLESTPQPISTVSGSSPTPHR